MAKQKEEVPARPTTANEKSPCLTDFEMKIDVALQVTEMLSGLRSAAICSGESGGLTPKEGALYSAALHRLESYLDSAD